jgi:hypothetical protein
MHGCAVITGCEYENENLAHMRIYKAGCTPAKVADAIYKRKSLGHSCTICTYVATGKNPARNLADHIRKNHKFSQKCNWPRCIDQTVYTSADMLRDHRDRRSQEVNDPNMTSKHLNR